MVKTQRPLREIISAHVSDMVTSDEKQARYRALGWDVVGWICVVAVMLTACVALAVAVSGASASTISAIGGGSAASGAAFAWLVRRYRRGRKP